jgi:hypothetical protein
MSNSIDTVYFWLWLRCPRSRVCRWLYVRFVAAREIRKHLYRRNWRHALRYLKLL